MVDSVIQPSNNWGMTNRQKKQIQTLLIAQKPKFWSAFMATVFTEQKEKQKRRSVRQRELFSET